MEEKCYLFGVQITCTYGRTHDAPICTYGLYEQALAAIAQKAIAQKDALIAELRSQLNASESDNRSCRRLMKKACDILMDTASGKERING